MTTAPSPLLRRAFSVVVALALGAAAREAQSGALAPERIAAFTTEALPLVREALGVELADVEVRLATQAEIEAALRAESGELYARLAGDPALGARQAAEFARAIAPYLLAKYAFAENDVLLQAGAFERLAPALGVPELTGESVVRAVLLHELVHAADDERHDFTALFARCSSQDALRGLGAVVEGHAQLVARDLAPRFGCAEGLATYTRAITAPDRALVEAGGEGAELMMRTTGAIFASSYLDGETFFAALRAAGGEEAVQRAFREPPADAVVVARPEWYLAPELRPRIAFDLEPALDAFVAGFEDEGGNEQRLSASAADLRAAFAPLPPEEIDAISATMRQNRVVTLVDPRGKQVTLGVFEFGTAEEAAAYLALYERLQHARDEAMKEGLIRIVSSEYERLPPSGPGGILVSKRVATPAFVDLSTVCATHGPLALELMAAGAPDWDGERLVEAARATFEETLRHPRSATPAEEPR